jgi:hypothetical protein
VARIDGYLGKAYQSSDQVYWDAVALNLHAFYSGVERIFEDIARTIDASLPIGPDWRVDLPTQMAADLLPVRPAVISRETRACLDSYRGFRHIVRNVYTFSLRPSRIKELAEELPVCFAFVSNDFDKFAAFIVSIDSA